MRANLGVKNKILGGVFAFLNGYVFLYFIIIPVFSLNLIDSTSHVTNFVIDHPPSFIRIARTAEKMVPIKNLADKADDFQKLLSTDGIEGYYNDAIYSYQQQYLGASNSYESKFMNQVYPFLEESTKEELNSAYYSYFNEELRPTNYTGISVVLLEEINSKLLYLELISLEDEYFVEVEEAKVVVSEYDAAVATYNKLLINYNYQVAYELYLDEVEEFEAYTIDYLERKHETISNGGVFNEFFSKTRPVLNVSEPDDYEALDELVEPTIPEYTKEIEDAQAFVHDSTVKTDVRTGIENLGENFVDHEGILRWYVDVLDRESINSATSDDITNTIISFKENYEEIMSNIDDNELESKLELAEMAIRSYDVFSQWLTCTLDNIDNLELEDIPDSENRCTDLDPDLVESYDFTEDALSIISTLLEGNNVSYVIVQFKYDYDTGIFTELFKDYPVIIDILEQSEELIYDYDTYYKDIAASIDGSLPMVGKIGISVMKYKFDVYEQLEETPVLRAMFNDFSRLCTRKVLSPLDRNVTVCATSTASSSIISELFNLRALISEVIFKAYIMVDDNNEAIIYDSNKMEELLLFIDESIDNHIYTKEVVSMIGDQFAFNITNADNNETLLEEMYNNGQITVEAMRILADDEHDLFSDEFSYRVRSLIR